jgi:Tfp pilus assembly protein PilO
MSILNSITSKIFKNSTQEQRKIIYIALVVLFALICFLVLVYLPSSGKLSAIRKELSRSEDEISRIMSMVAGKELPEAVKDLKLRFNKARGLLADSPENVVYRLTEFAKKQRIRVVNVSPGKEEILEGAIAGYKVSALPIRLTLVGDYRDIGEYLGQLSMDFPYLLAVKSLDISGKGEGRVDLDVTIDLTAYEVEGG